MDGGNKVWRSDQVKSKMWSLWKVNATNCARKQSDTMSQNVATLGVLEQSSNQCSES